MKSNTLNTCQHYLAQAIISIALFLGIFTSCQEHDFADELGFESSDDLRAAISAEKVAKDLTESLGYEVNHKADQFGFDVAAQALSLAETRAATRAEGDLPSGIYKPEEHLQTIAKKYGTVPNITQKEHDEVFAWFSNHKVEWVTTPTVAKVGESTRQLKNGNGVYGTAIGLQPENYEGYGSLRNYNVNQLGNASVGSAIHFNYAWIQRVASDDNSKDEKDIDGGNIMSGSDGFNQLGVWNGTEWIHTNDFNGTSGWGWGRQNETREFGEWWQKEKYNKNGVFFCNVDCSQITAQSSKDGSKDHDKWIIVSLKGDDYEGTYLGFDFESLGNNPNEKYAANGICNDWIIKITPSTTDISKYENYRIMCEDLGASFDVDYNDLVLDVEWDGLFGGSHIVNPMIRIDIVSACGSLPISIWYDGDYKGEVHEKLGAKMKDDGTYDPIKPNEVNKSKSNLQYSRDWGSADAKTQINLIDIKVCQDPAAWKKAKEQGKMAERAIWTSVHNFAGKIPLKICVPQSVRIATESGIEGDRRFERAYPMFPKWLKNEETYSGTGFPFWQICDERWVYSN